MYRFDQHTDAAQAITAKHGTQLEGYTIKCSWGKEGAGLPSTMGSSAYNGVRFIQNLKRYEK